MTKVARYRRHILAALGTVAVSVTIKASKAGEPVMIFAAATLKPALDAVVEAAKASLHVPVTIVYGPSPALVKQLDNGAPGDIFFSADADWMDDAIARKIVEPSARVDLLSSTLVLIAPAGHTEVTIAPGFPLAALLGSGRLAMCDPMMMPAGRYGRTALQKLGVWDSVKDRLATAADVLAALAYVSRHEAALGIVFDTEGARLDQGVTVIGTVPDDSHQRIVYPLAKVARSHNPDASGILNFLTSPEARQIFKTHGYAVLPPNG
jgi:molybdate transport system substrate-binding protein